MAKIEITIYECPRGHQWDGRTVNCISIGDRRITSVKCCGSWKTVRSWLVDADKVIETINKANFEAMRENGKKNRQKVNA